jgi:hypothetical protein
LCCTDPFQNDETYLLSVLSLEELGATGNKVRYPHRDEMLTVSLHYCHI